MRFPSPIPALILALAFGSSATAGSVDIKFHNDQAGYVSLNVEEPGTGRVQQVMAGDTVPLPAGDHTWEWDGRFYDGKTGGGVIARPGVYEWKAVVRPKLSLEVLGYVGDFGSSIGPPSAVAADDTRVYLGWSQAGADDDAIVACSPAGKILWSTNFATHANSGCRALAADGGFVYVLGGEGDEATGRAIYKLNAKTGDIVSWPDGDAKIQVSTLWPAKGSYKPVNAEHMAVRNGRIYLSFTVGEFAAILDAKTGKYLQTIVGAAPGAIDAAGTQSDDPSNTGKMLDADFLVTALKQPAIGKLLLAHDPIWVLDSEATELNPVERINTLEMIGDGAKFHMHDIFVGLGAPVCQVQARSALETETVSYSAGGNGGRVTPGPWQADRFGDIRALALDGTGQLWVAEGDSAPKRFSVWSTNGVQGKLLREYFAAPEPGCATAVDPDDPTVFYAGGCEWKLAGKNGPARCLGVITRQAVADARFIPAQGKLCLSLTMEDKTVENFERVGAGNFRKWDGPAPDLSKPEPYSVSWGPQTWHIHTADGFDLGALPSPSLDDYEMTLGFVVPSPWPYKNPQTLRLSTAGNGEAFLTISGGNRLFIARVKGMESVRPAGHGTITIP